MDPKKTESSSESFRQATPQDLHQWPLFLVYRQLNSHGQFLRSPGQTMRPNKSARQGS